MCTYLFSFHHIAAKASLLGGMYQTEALIRNFYQAFSFCLWVITNRRKKAKQLRLFIKRLFRYSPEKLIAVRPQK